ncbi:hypothetical protein VRB38_20920 [Pseudomonas trivialis]|uniref:hypothetical protein n=2 Tax=Pseudomonas trivialis TaxID=200450 RepID=UPI0030D46A74
MPINRLASVGSPEIKALPVLSQSSDTRGHDFSGFPNLRVHTKRHTVVENYSPSRVHHYAGLLNKSASLAAEHQARLQPIVDAWKARQIEIHSDRAQGPRSIIELLLRTLPHGLTSDTHGPDEILNAILDSAQGQALGALLQKSNEAMPASTSAYEALLTAVLLDVDPAGGPQRNSLASYSLRQQSNWGRSAPDIVKDFESYLTPRFGEAIAKVAVFLLLSVSAPEFLVKDLPSTLVYGSHQWATFSAAVARIEAGQPGSAASMSYCAVMALDEIEPVSVAEKRQQQFAQMTAVIDWAIANGVILENSDDAYSAADIERAVDAMQAQHEILADSVTALSTPMPTRRELALTELRRVYGIENQHFFEQRLLADTVPGSPGRKAYSLLDIYMSGDLGKHFWISRDADFDTVKVNVGLPKLKNIKREFEDKFNDYIQDLNGAFNAQFKYQLSLLPAEDRRLIEYGKVTTFELGFPDRHQGPVSPDHKINTYINSGAILFRADLDGKVCHYLYSPVQGRIIKDADPSRPGLQFPGSRLYFSIPRPDSPEGKEPAVTILWQALGTPWPEENPIDFAALSIYPSRSLQAGTSKPYPVTPPDTFTSPKSGQLAAAIGAYYTRGLQEAKVTANGTTEQEREEHLSNAVNQFFLGLVPFYSAVRSFIDGRPAEGFFNALLDVFGFFVPALKGGIQGVRLGVKSGVGSALGFIKGFAKAGVQSVNPLAGVYDVGRGVFKLGKAGFKKLTSLNAGQGSFTPSLWAQKDNIAEGIYRPLGVHGEAAAVTAIELNGKWYAFDIATQTPYGAPLKGFISKSISNRIGPLASTALDTVTQVGFSGTSVFVEKALVRHYGREPAHGVTFDPADVKVSDVPSAPSFIDPSLLSRFDNASRYITELDELTIECGFLAEAPIKIAHVDLHKYAYQLEVALDRLEDRTVQIAEAYEVFCKPYNPHDDVNHRYAELQDRVEAIEERIDAIRNALTRVRVMQGRGS